MEVSRQEEQWGRTHGLQGSLRTQLEGRVIKKTGESECCSPQCLCSCECQGWVEENRNRSQKATEHLNHNEGS